MITAEEINFPHTRQFPTFEHNSLPLPDREGHVALRGRVCEPPGLRVEESLRPEPLRVVAPGLRVAQQAETEVWHHRRTRRDDEVADLQGRTKAPGVPAKLIFLF